MGSYLQRYNLSAKARPTTSVGSSILHHWKHLQGFQPTIFPPHPLNAPPPLSWFWVKISYFPVLFHSSRSFSLSPFFPPHFCGRKPPALQHMAIQAIDCSFCFLRPIDPIFPGWPKVEISLANQVFWGRGKFFQNIPNLPLKRILGVGEKSWWISANVKVTKITPTW